MLAAFRLTLVTDFRRMEILPLERAWIDPEAPCVRFPMTKSGAQLPAIGKPAPKQLLAQPSGGGNPVVIRSETGIATPSASSDFSCASS